MNVLAFCACGSDSDNSGNGGNNNGESGKDIDAGIKSSVFNISANNKAAMDASFPGVKKSASQM